MLGLPAIKLSCPRDVEASNDPHSLQRFSAQLPAELSSTEEIRLRTEIERLSPWLQGPFDLGGGVVIEGQAHDDLRWQAIRPQLPDLTGKRVLDVGAGAGYDAFMFRVCGAAEVLACEPSELIQQARFLESVFNTGVRLEQIAWQDLDPQAHGTFDVVHCRGVLQHEPNPIALIARLRSLLGGGGQLLLGSIMLADAEYSEHVRFVPGAGTRQPGLWWVPGRLALRWMIDACGLVSELLPLALPALPSEAALPNELEVIDGYVRAVPAQPDTSSAGAHERAPSSAAPRDRTSFPLLSKQRLVPINRYPVGHYHSPMYDTTELAGERTRLWPATPHATIGVDWRPEAQLELCRTVFARQQRLEFIERAGADPTEYHARNDSYSPLDAWVLAGLLEHLRPARMIEVGCGLATLVSARVNRERLDESIELTCIEPHPPELLAGGVPGVSDLRVERVQETPLELFAQLTDGDVLFLDTSHAVKTGGDVVWIFNEIIPRLRAGVYVHVHDVFLPSDYPERWVFEGRGWNENYLVQAFLAFNREFDVVWGQQYMLRHHLDEVVLAFPGFRLVIPPPAALWMRRREQEAAPGIFGLVRSPG